MTQHERFEAWLKDKYGDMFDPIGEDYADTVVRLVKIVASEAHEAAEAASLKRAAQRCDEIADELVALHELESAMGAIKCREYFRALLEESR